jgi:hypothetical protein
MVRMIALAALTACAAPSGADWDQAPALDWEALPGGVAGPPAPFTLELSEAILGQDLRFTVSGAASGQALTAFRTRSGLGGGRCYAQLGGQCLDLSPQIHLQWQTNADRAGTATVDVSVPSRPWLAGVEVCFQVVSQLGAGGVDSEIAAPVCTVLDYDDDNDGVNNSHDVCPGADDLDDADEDGIPAGCDDTPLGLCTGVVCAASDDCHLPGACDMADGSCTDPTAPDSAVCEVSGGLGECLAGVCEITACDPGYLRVGDDCLEVRGPARASCTAHYDAGERSSGLFLVDPLSTGVGRAAWCDLNDGGWTLVLRGAGGSHSGDAWQTTGAIEPTGGPWPGADGSFKLSDAEINALRGGAGPYRLEYNGTALPMSPPVAYVSGQCTYQHTASRLTETVANRACRTWSLSPDLSSPVVSATNQYRKGIIVGSPAVGNGFLSYLTNFDIDDPARDGWYAGDIAVDSGWCLPGDAGCDIAMYVKAVPGPVVRESCTAHHLAGETADGVYAVDPLGTGAFDVYCDMTNGGWTLVMRGYGGDNAGNGWNLTGEIVAAGSPSPTMTESLKLSDAQINALRQGGGRYRISYNGATGLFTPLPPTVYIPGACTYSHTASASGACLQYSTSPDLSGLATSMTNVGRRGIVVGSTTTGSGFISYLTNFNQSGSTNGWFAGDVGQNSDWCHSAQAGCDFVMFVSAE